MSSATGPAAAQEMRQPWLRGRRVTVLVAGPPLIFLIVCFIVPVGFLLAYSFGDQVGAGSHITGTLTQYQQLFASGQLWHLLWKTVMLSGVATLICVVIGLPTAWIIGRVVPERWRNVSLLLLIMPSWTSFVVRTYSMLLLLGNQGLVNSWLHSAGLIQHPLSLIFNDTSVLIGLVYIGLPWMVLPLYASVARLDGRFLEAARSLGSGRIRLFMRVILPLVAPGLVVGTLMVFIPALGQFVVSAIVGGKDGFLYTNAIDAQFTNFDWPLAAAMSSVLLVLSLIIVMVLLRLVRLSDIREVAGGRGA